MSIRSCRLGVFAVAILCLLPPSYADEETSKVHAVMPRFYIRGHCRSGSDARAESLLIGLPCEFTTETPPDFFKDLKELTVIAKSAAPVQEWFTRNIHLAPRLKSLTLEVGEPETQCPWDRILRSAQNFLLEHPSLDTLAMINRSRPFELSSDLIREAKLGGVNRLRISGLPCHGVLSALLSERNFKELSLSVDDDIGNASFQLNREDLAAIRRCKTLRIVELANTLSQLDELFSEEQEFPLDELRIYRSKVVRPLGIRNVRSLKCGWCAFTPQAAIGTLTSPELKSIRMHQCTFGDLPEKLPPIAVPSIVLSASKVNRDIIRIADALNASANLSVRTLKPMDKVAISSFTNASLISSSSDVRSVEDFKSFPKLKRLNLCVVNGGLSLRQFASACSNPSLEKIVLRNTSLIPGDSVVQSPPSATLRHIEWGGKDAPAALCDYLVRIPNLTVLSFCQCDLRRTQLSFLMKCPTLQEVSFDLCELSGNQRDDIVAISQRLKVTLCSNWLTPEEKNGRAEIAMLKRCRAENMDYEPESSVIDPDLRDFVCSQPFRRVQLDGFPDIHKHLSKVRAAQFECGGKWKPNLYWYGDDAGESPDGPGVALDGEVPR